MYDYRLISERLNLMKKIMPFHLAIPVDCLIKARQFYGELLGCEEGRSSDIWIDYNFYGHQLVCHCTEKSQSSIKDNPVDGKNVPVPHFGVVLERQDWQDLRDKLVSHGIQFLIEPYIRFEGQTGEQATMFFFDPSGNALEFKSFKNIDTELFRK